MLNLNQGEKKPQQNYSIVTTPAPLRNFSHHSKLRFYLDCIMMKRLVSRLAYHLQVPHRP